MISILMVLGISLWSATACRRFVTALLPGSPPVTKRRQAVALQSLTSFFLESPVLKKPN